MMARGTWLWLHVAVCLAACGEAPLPADHVDASRDAAGHDGGAMIDASLSDGQMVVDASVPDAMTWLDAQVRDATRDAFGVMDARVVDAGADTAEAMSADAAMWNDAFVDAAADAVLDASDGADACPSGFITVGSECADVDECAAGADDCAALASCTNTLGSFECACRAGYEGDGRRCVDVDECVRGGHDCSDRAYCTNLSGGFRCDCMSGFRGDGVICNDVDECSAVVSRCDTMPRAACTNLDGSFACTCPAGYDGDGVGAGGCVDVDECSAPGRCGDHGVCTNLTGSFTCACTSGYLRQAAACVDVDECNRRLDNCDSRPEACVNTVGGYQCICPEGTSGHGVGVGGCQDADECALGNHQCLESAACVNQVPGYRCVCPSGYTGDGIHECLAISELDALLASHGALSPGFDPARRHYMLSVPAQVAALTLTPTGSGEIRVNGTLVSSGVASSPIAILPPMSLIEVTIESPGFGIGTYVITVLRGGPTYLKELVAQGETPGTFEGVCRSSVDADTIVYGSGNAGEELGGRAYVAVRAGDAWVPQALLSLASPTQGDRFAHAIAVSGDTLVVGAPGHSSDAGRAFVYTRAAGTWTLQATLVGSNTAEGDSFGTSVAIDGNRIAVGAPHEDGSGVGRNPPNDDNSADSGAAYLFTRSGSTWAQEAYLKASNNDASDWFGIEVSLSGTRLAIGAILEDSGATLVNGDQANDALPDSGAVYAFRLDGTWQQDGYLKAPNPVESACFGGVSISGNTVVVASICGGTAAEVYVVSGSSWSHQAHVAPSGAAPDDLATAVAISGDRLLIGAEGEDSDAIGVGGDATNNRAQQSGAAYLFERTGTLWTQTKFIKASNTDTDDAFGACVTLHGTTMAIGASQERSVATGVGGDQSDNNGVADGAVYVY